jgi:hypothetical protein
MKMPPPGFVFVPPVSSQAHTNTGKVRRAIKSDRFLRSAEFERATTRQNIHCIFCVLIHSTHFLGARFRLLYTSSNMHAMWVTLYSRATPDSKVAASSSSSATKPDKQQEAAPSHATSLVTIPLSPRRRKIRFPEDEVRRPVSKTSSGAASLSPLWRRTVISE